MKLLKTALCTFAAFVWAASVTGAPISPPSAWTLSVEPSSSSSKDKSVSPEDLTLPGFAGMLRNTNSTAVNKYAISDLSEGIQLDGGTCKYVKLGGGGKVGETSLEAKCMDGAGTWWDTSLNLNDCAANEGGFLVFREDGNFDESCRPCMVLDLEDVGGLQLKCKCVNNDREYQYALLPLGSHINHPLAIKPIHGRLTCGSKYGVQTPSFYEH